MIKTMISIIQWSNGWPTDLQWRFTIEHHNTIGHHALIISLIECLASWWNMFYVIHLLIQCHPWKIYLSLSRAKTTNLLVWDIWWRTCSSLCIQLWRHYSMLSQLVLFIIAYYWHTFASILILLHDVIINNNDAVLFWVVQMHHCHPQYDMDFVYLFNSLALWHKPSYWPQLIYTLWLSNALFTFSCQTIPQHHHQNLFLQHPHLHLLRHHHYHLLRHCHHHPLVTATTWHHHHQWM